MLMFCYAFIEDNGVVLRCFFVAGDDGLGGSSCGSSGGGVDGGCSGDESEDNDAEVINGKGKWLSCEENYETVNCCNL